MPNHSVRAQRRPTSLGLEAFALVASLVFALACAPSPASPKATHTAAPAGASTAAFAVPTASGTSPPASLEACTTTSLDTVAPVSFLGAPRVFEVRVARVAPGPLVGSELMGDRCVALDLDFVEDFHGHGREKPNDRLHIMVKQSLATVSSAPPAGTWWVGEQKLEPGAELVAFCIEGAAAKTLVDSCHVLPAADVRADLVVARDVDRNDVSAIDLAELMRKRCAETSFLLVDYLWMKRAAEARRDPKVFGAIVSLLEEPKCPIVVKNALVGTLAGGLGEAAVSLPHVRRLTLALFHMLDIAELKVLHDNVVDPFLMVVLGLQSGAPRFSATQLFGTDVSARRSAKATLDAYRGSANTAKLRAWLAVP